MSNIFKTTLLLTGMTLLLMLAGRAFGGQNGMLMALLRRRPEFRLLLFLR